MSSTSKSPKQVLHVAYELGRRRLRTHWHKYSPKKFTVPQLFACLVLKEFMRLDYRKLSALLRDAPQLAKAIDLDVVPHFSTFQKAAARLLNSRRVQHLLDETISTAQQLRIMRKTVTLAAIDGTGFESRHISSYFVRRRDRDCKKAIRRRLTLVIQPPTFCVIAPLISFLESLRGEAPGLTTRVFNLRQSRLREERR